MAKSAPAIELPSIRAVAASWGAEKQQAIADEMLHDVGMGISSIIDNEQLMCLGRGTCLAIVELTLAMIEHAIPADRAEPPVVAIEHARLLADRGLPLEALLRAYRLGHACFARRVADAMMELTQDPAELVRGVRETERFLFAFVDVISSKVGAAYIDQRQRVTTRAASMRRDVVRALLDGHDIDITRAERSLGHSLSGPQLAFICWGDGDSAALQQAAAAMQEVLSAPRPVLLPSDDCVLSGWFDVTRGMRAGVEALAKATGAAAPAAHIALGPVLPGLNGFQRSRAGAQRVKRIVDMTARHPPTMTEWTNIALVDALSADLDAARELVRTELRALNRPGDHNALLRQTAQAFVLSGFSYAAVASSLHIHRNTALQRVKKAEALRGKPFTERPAELLAALMLVDAIGATLLDH
ncbi:helix-turn-helix domain-containing protein [Mycobacterium sp. URHB0044]|uniref:helix-turn-helix domain-containing protein n=1 Tax=Mycobacterium sp. URHB0044 TaxID=1380386 RepID=UPI000B24D85C|nr:helix-turn-helix domain-containing protein [Mycobacterium sp. URHB0044]